MKRGAFFKRAAKKFFPALALIGLACYTLFHTLSLSAESLMTMPVRSITDNTVLAGEAYLFREEELLTVDRPGLVDPIAESGEKVSSSAELCRVWSDDSAEDGTLSEKQKRLDALNRAITVLEKGIPRAGTPLSEISATRDAAEEILLSIRSNLQNGNWGGLSDREDEMLAKLLSSIALTDSENGYSEILSALRQEKEKLLSGVPTTLCNKDTSGYFYERGEVDGYETVFTEAALKALTPASFEKLRQASPVLNEHTVGKMVWRYDWHLAVSFSGADATLFEVGTVYSVSFPENGDRVLPLTCQSVKSAEDGTVLVILHSEVTPASFSFYRSQQIHLTVESVEGYYVPENALVRQDGQLGVFLFEGSTLHFTPISLLRQADGYVIAASEEDGIALNDLMVTSGKKLYDGKVYQ